MEEKDKIIIDLSPLEEEDIPLYKKAIAYQREGRVTNLHRDASNYFSAIVTGKQRYQVSLRITNGKLTFHQCNCEAHKRFPGPCKHIIATLIEVANTYGKNPPSSEDNFVDIFDDNDGFISDL